MAVGAEKWIEAENVSLIRVSIRNWAAGGGDVAWSFTRPSSGIGMQGKAWERVRAGRG